ncbi:MAG: hypothetical protein K8W52_40170 [Deltaproteobacteria bacterium]|nr:hypothetical protein [Deltaproteobacteria bacterium]
MNRKALLGMIVLAACSKPPAPAGPTPGAAAALPACPTGDALDAKAAALAKVPVADLALKARCAPAHLPAPGFVLDTWALRRADDETTLVHRTAALDASFAELAASEAPMEDVNEDSIIGEEIDHYAAIDFDHDGVDERVMIVRDIYGGVGTDRLEVARYAGGAWTEVFARQVAYDTSTAGGDEADIVSCETSWKVGGAEGGPRTIELVPHGAPSEECPGAETWAPGPTGEFVKR